MTAPWPPARLFQRRDGRQQCDDGGTQLLRRQRPPTRDRTSPELTNFNTLRTRLIQPVAESKIPDDMEYYASDTDDEDCVAQIQHFPRQ